MKKRGKINGSLPPKSHACKVPPKEYFEKHPEWFSLIGGKRTSDQAQLCLTNQELRATIIEKLKAYIEQARAEARTAGRPAPRDFDISQNDWGGMCECSKCRQTVQREGSQSGPLLDFLNYVADAVRDNYPEVRINTLAYVRDLKIWMMIKLLEDSYRDYEALVRDGPRTGSPSRKSALEANDSQRPSVGYRTWRAGSVPAL